MAMRSVETRLIFSMFVFDAVNIRSRTLEKWGEYFMEAKANGKDCYVYCKHEDEGSPWVWADHLLKMTSTTALPGGNHG